MLERGLHPRVEIEGRNGKEPWMESLLWRNGDQSCLVILKNPSNGSAEILGEEGRQIWIRLNLRVHGLRNLRTGKVVGDVTSFTEHSLRGQQTSIFSPHAERSLAANPGSIPQSTRV